MKDFNEHKLPLAIIFLLIAHSAFAYTITGKVTDEETNAGLAGVRITALNDSSAIVATGTAESNGVFTVADISDPLVLVEISLDGYLPQYLRVRGYSDDVINQGIIPLRKDGVQLDELVVQAERVIQRPDRTILMPSAE